MRTSIPFMLATALLLAASPAVQAHTVVSEGFQPRFSLSVPGDWKVVVDEPGYFAVARVHPENPQWPVIGIDLTVAEQVAADPCETDLFRPSGADDIGPSPSDLVEWMESLDRLGATEAEQVTPIAGRPTLSFDESFVEEGDCPALLMWDTGAGWVFQEEHKRYFVFDVDGQRLVAVIVAPDETFDRDVAEALEALETLTFVDDTTASPPPG